MEIELYEHNEIAYQKLSEYLKTHQLASIDHATGTGKSFIIAKYLNDYKDKKVLYLTPTYLIFTQLIDHHFPKINLNKNDFPNLDNIIYRNMLKENMEDIASKYDIIVLDEYHRCGAKEWGTKIKELKKIIQEKYPEKKIIGLTATPTRYLDNERNMNEELFEGASVSIITLGDAILQGLLQPPLYINTANSYKEYLYHIKQKLKRKLVYEENMAEFNQLLSTVDENIEKYLESKLDKDIELPRENGKYIVFCNTISEIKNQQEIIKNKFKNYNLKFYEVHSNQTREKNEEQLKEFRNNQENSNFIFVVDILNEGIHVDDIDGIFLLRKTHSPIIYFQQLGRLLSFSTKQKNLTVWDMVDNIKNHRIIYNLYDEVITKAKELIETDPNNKERYQNIINRFKIVDNYTEIMTKLNKIEKEIDKLTEEKLLRLRINQMVKILSDQYKTNSSLPREKQIEQLFKANSDLYKYYKHINLEQFRLLKKASINLPPQINISEEAFTNKLLIFNTLNERVIAEQTQIFNTFKKYIDTHKHLPSILSTSKNEQDYAYLISSNISKYDKKIRQQFIECIKTIPDKSNTFDKYYYINIEENPNLDEFFKSLDYCLKEDIPINENIVILLNRLSVNQDVKKKYKIDKYLNQLKYKTNIKDTNQFEIKPVNEYKISKESKIQDPLKELKKYGLTSINKDDIKEFISNYVKELTDFIDKNSRYPNLREPDEYQKYLAFKPFLEQYGYKKNLDQKAKSGENQEFKIFIEEIIEFMKNNYGDYPSDRVKDELEIKLAKKIKKNKSKLQNYQIELEVLRNKIRTIKNDNWIYEYINFLEKYKRHPIIQSTDTYEVYLRTRYLRNEEYMTKEEKQQLKKIINELDETIIIKNTYIERQRVRRK